MNPTSPPASTDTSEIQTEAPRVFLSYSSQDATLAHTVVGDLELRGVSVINKVPPEPGTSVSSAIASGISNANAVLVLITARAYRSPWVSREIGYALGLASERRPIPIIPLLAEREAELPPFLRDIKYVDMSSPDRYGVGLDEVVSAVRSHPGEVLEASIAARNALVHAERAVMAAERMALVEMSLRKSAKMARRLAILSAATLFVGVVGFLVAQGPRAWEAPFPRALIGFLAGVTLGVLLGASTGPRIVGRVLRRFRAHR